MANATAQGALTMRRDAWWIAPLLTVIVLSGFGIYATWRAFENRFYEVGPYLSPFYSPLLHFGWWRFSPAILILWAPLGFRVTCYYYRKAYYRAFFWDPPACAVGEPRKGYNGETRFPFILQNIHRYFFYAATIVLVFLWYDAIKAFIFDGHFGVGVGSIVLFVNNIILLPLYSFSCHSFRHLIGGHLDQFSRCPTRYKLWGAVSVLNNNHMLWAWISLFSVALADFYIRLVASGAINDVRLL